MKRSFKSWLLSQHERKDPVGHLAIDFRDDIQTSDPEHPLPRPFTPEGCRVYVLGRNASAGALRALDRAEVEWWTVRSENAH